MVFVNKKDRIIIITNYKVMYSTFNNHKDYDLVNGLAMIAFLLNPLFKKYFFKRSPYKRVESFFKDKILTNPSKRNIETGWQFCQQVILDFYGIKGFENQVQFLKMLSFEHFVNDLDNFYLKDQHLRPQFIAVSKFGLYYGFLFKQIDIDRDKDFIRKVIFEDRNIGNNRTQNITFEYSDEMKKMIRFLYKKDFNLLKY